MSTGPGKDVHGGVLYNTLDEEFGLADFSLDTSNYYMLVTYLS